MKTRKEGNALLGKEVWESLLVWTWECLSVLNCESLNCAYYTVGERKVALQFIGCWVTRKHIQTQEDYNFTQGSRTLLRDAMIR